MICFDISNFLPAQYSFWTFLIHLCYMKLKGKQKPSGLKNWLLKNRIKFVTCHIISNVLINIRIRLTMKWDITLKSTSKNSSKLTGFRIDLDRSKLAQLWNIACHFYLSYFMVVVKSTVNRGFRCLLHKTFVFV